MQCSKFAPGGSHTLQITAGGKTRQVELGRCCATGWFLLDLFTTGPIGIIIDWMTHDWASADAQIILLGR